MLWDLRLPPLGYPVDVLAGFVMSGDAAARSHFAVIAKSDRAGVSRQASPILVLVRDRSIRALQEFMVNTNSSGIKAATRALVSLPLQKR